MRISYKQYRNSRLATFLDAMGSLICIIPVFGIVVLLQAMLSDNTNTDISVIDTVGTILVLGFFLGLGIGLKLLGKRIAENELREEKERQKYYQEYMQRRMQNNENVIKGQNTASLYCGNCGCLIPSEGTFCPECGCRVRK